MKSILLVEVSSPTTIAESFSLSLLVKILLVDDARITRYQNKGGVIAFHSQAKSMERAAKWLRFRAWNDEEFAPIQEMVAAAFSGIDLVESLNSLTDKIASITLAIPSDTK